MRIHKLPDFAYFNHCAHVGVGVGENRAAIGCETCHGRIDTMEVVKQVQPLSMSWCLECHSNPGAEPAAGGGDHQPWAGRATSRGATRRKHIAATLNPPGSLSGAQKLMPDGHSRPSPRPAATAVTAEVEERYTNEAGSLRPPSRPEPSAELLALARAQGR